MKNDIIYSHVSKHLGKFSNWDQISDHQKVPTLLSLVFAFNLETTYINNLAHLYFRRTSLSQLEIAIACLRSTPAQHFHTYVKTFGLQESDSVIQSDEDYLSAVKLLNEQPIGIVDKEWALLMLKIQFDKPISSELLVKLWKFQTSGKSLLRIIGCQFDDHNRPSDMILYHMSMGLESALECLSQEQTKHIVQTIKARYAKLKQLYPNSIYCNTPSWFTGEW